MRLNAQTEVQNIQWTIISKSDESFIPFARYSFNVDGKNYHGQTRWQQSSLKKKFPIGLATILFSRKLFFAKTIPFKGKSLFTPIMDLSDLFLWVRILF